MLDQMVLVTAQIVVMIGLIFMGLLFTIPIVVLTYDFIKQLIASNNAN